LIIIVLTAFFYGVPIYYPQLNALQTIGVLIGVFGGIYIFFDAISTLIQPLRSEAHAFKKIAKAIEILERSKEPIAYKEAYHCIKKAYSILDDIELSELEWYEEVNQTFEQLLKNIRVLVLPAVNSHEITIRQLEEIAFAILSLNSKEVRKVNKKLESTYRKTLTVAIPLRERLSTNKNIKHIIFTSIFGIGCGVFYYFATINLGVSKDTALMVSVPAFIGLLAIYFRKPSKE